MDTDDLTPMAYELLDKSYLVHDALKSVIGASAMCYTDEEGFLRGTLQNLDLMIDEPRAYLDFWNLHDVYTGKEFGRRLNVLREHILATLATPLSERGKPPFA